MIHLFDNAPGPVAEIYRRALDDRTEQGDETTAAEQYALRQVQLAGWYRAPGGKWEQLTSDLRDKVNVRQAIKQPDGNFAVFDVDVFYPNAAKGPELVYDAQRVRRAIANTNAAIEAGGQRPGLCEGHTHPLQAASGMQLPTYGAGVNWRESPRGKSWARCDLVDVQPSVIDRLRTRMLTGLSAALAWDAEKLNERFGHVAMLGGQIQALSRLPRLEVFSTQQQVCFSAEVALADAFHPKGRSMLTQKQLALYAALGAAYAAMGAGEPGAEDKLKQARADYAAEFGSDPMADLAAGGAMPTVPADPALGGNPAAVPAGPTDTVPTLPDAAMFAADPAAAFDASTRVVANIQRQMQQNRENDRRTIDQLKGIVTGLVGKEIRTQFAAEIAELKRNGHYLPSDESIDSQFAAAAKSGKDGVDGLIALLKSTPKRDSLAGVGPVFGADNGNPAAKPGPYNPDVASIMNDIGTAVNFSADDMAFGTMIAGIEAKRKH